MSLKISIHKALAGLDEGVWDSGPVNDISIHKALAGLDILIDDQLMLGDDFNPQGPRGPRQMSIRI